MKYVKTFESFNYESTNEGWLWGEGNIWKKAKDAFVNWKNEKLKSVADKLAKAIDEKKDDPEMQEALENVKREAEKLPAEDKQKIAEFAKGEIPEVEVSESLLLEGDTPMLNKILMRIGLSTAAFGFVSAMITLLKITGAVAGATMFGVFIGTAIGICAGILAIGGVIAAIGHTRQQAIVDREKSKEAMDKIRKHYGYEKPNEEQ
jgi:hypothetical protein